MGKILGNASKPYAKRTWRGKPFDNRTVSALKWVEQKYIEVAPKKRAPLVFYQGSYSTGASPNSKGTHDGGGAVDVNVSGMTHKQKMALVKWFRKGGWSAWLRPRMSDTWPEHIHAILRGHRTASPGAGVGAAPVGHPTASATFTVGMGVRLGGGSWGSGPVPSARVRRACSPQAARPANAAQAIRGRRLRIGPLRSGRCNFAVAACVTDEAANGCTRA